MLIIASAEMWWVSPLIVGGIALLGLAVNYGAFGRDIKNINTAVAAVNAKADKVDSDLDSHKNQVWPRINANEVEIAKVKGHLGINGGDYPRGKGHHQ